jgi:hypothetical protein
MFGDDDRATRVTGRSCDLLVKVIRQSPARRSPVPVDPGPTAVPAIARFRTCRLHQLRWTTRGPRAIIAG